MMLARRKKGVARNKPKKATPGWVTRVANLPWRRMAPVGGVVLAVIAVLVTLRIALDQPVQRVAISGRFQRVQPLDVEKAVRIAVNGQGMVGVDLERIAAAVESIPWVDRASVARSWPRQLRVQVVEQTPVARWGESGLVNTRGEVFVQDAQHIPAELPELVGPPGYETQMTQRYLAAQRVLAEANMRLTRMTLDERGAWDLLLANGVTLRLGRENVDERFERFITAAVRIVASRAAEIAYVDLRYANGFAIGWRTGSSGVKRG
jgi:cell division protein FtsQ